MQKTQEKREEKMNIRRELECLVAESIGFRFGDALFRLYAAIMHDLTFLKAIVFAGRSQGAIFPIWAYLLDWDKAGEIKYTEDSYTAEDVWHWMIQCGFRKERVLKLVDPAIIPIVSRLLDLPLLTLNSCSSHDDGVNNPYLMVVFKDIGFGHEFIESLYEEFIDDEKLTIRGPSAKIFEDLSINSVPISACIDEFIPVSIHYFSDEIGEIIEFWYRFSRVVNEFDNKGACTIRREELKATDEGIIPASWNEKLFR